MFSVQSFKSCEDIEVALITNNFVLCAINVSNEVLMRHLYHCSLVCNNLQYMLQMLNIVTS